jgi:hypothetical protein
MVQEFNAQVEKTFPGAGMQQTADDVLELIERKPEDPPPPAGGRIIRP